MCTSTAAAKSPSLETSCSAYSHRKGWSWWNTPTATIRVAQLAQSVQPGKLGIDETWPSRFLIGLMAHRPDVQPVMGSLPVEQATMYKDEEERELMRNASRINDACMDMVIHAVHEGATERELSTKVENFFKEHGCNSLGFSIVGMGKNGADPHHDADSTVLQPGDSIVLDIGAPFGHYWCDMTRTIFYRSVSEEQRKVYETVRRANEAAIAIIKPGVAFKEFDLAARKVIEDARLWRILHPPYRTQHRHEGARASAGIL